MAEPKDDAPATEPEAPDPPEPAPARRPRKKAADKAEPPAPTPESIGIEGVVRVGGHRLDPDEGWVPDTDEPAEAEKED